MLKVREFNTIADLSHLRHTWAELLKQTADATWFHSLEWLETYWQFYGDSQQLRVLLIEEGHRPVGILPFVVINESRRVGAVKVLTYPLHGWGSFYSPIGPNPAATLDAGLRHIQETPHDWDLIDLRWIANGNDCGATSQAFHAAGFNHFANLWHYSAQVEIQNGWESYWSTRKGAWRSNVRRCQRRLAERGEVEHLRYRPLSVVAGDADPRWDLYDTCVEIARRSWQGQSKTGTTLSHDAVREYLRATHAAAVQAGAVDLNLLLLDSQPVAFAYNYHYQGSVYGLRSGFNANTALKGAGTVLMAHMIEDSCRRGDKLIDLGPDYLDCKRYWLTRLQPAYHYTHYRFSGMRAQALRIKQIIHQWMGGTWLSGTPIEKHVPRKRTLQKAKAR